MTSLENQSFMVRTENAAFETTTDLIMKGVGSVHQFNQAVKEAFQHLQTHAADGAVGVNGNFNGYRLSLHVIKDQKLS